MARILVVDDTRTIRTVLVEFLELEGHQCMQAGNVLEARLLLQNAHFDVVISDRNMMGESGIELLRYVFVHHPFLIFILMTALHDPAAMNAAMRLGAHAYMLKPFNLSDLLEKVNLALEKREESCISFPSRFPNRSSFEMHRSAGNSGI